ncbi:MAG: RIP metalloprotease RseP [Candidatus Adiutrix sp.]|nr:RIP metalloprotease RseP [Candidatus Adiutrix sp.]
MLTLVSFVVLLLVLIFVHELGHFIAAKLVGVKVERFSLGFPPKAVSRVIGETEYQLAWLPLGGYVKMYGEDPDSAEEVTPELRKRSFSHQPPWAKMVIVLAGPAFNLIFAAFLYWMLIWSVGIQHLPPVVGPVTPGSSAEAAGIAMDDVITEVDGRPVLYFDQLDQALSEGRGRPVRVVAARRGLKETYTLTPTVTQTADIFGDPATLYDVGINPRMVPVLAKVLEGKPAAEAGLRAGDLIVDIDGRGIDDWQDVLLAVQGPAAERASTQPRAVKPLVVGVLRDGRALTFEVTPQLNVSQNSAGETVFTPMIGMESKVEALTEPTGFFAAARLGVAETVRMIGLTLKSVQKLLVGQVSAKTLGGPILIAEIAGDRARAGWAPLLNLAAFISINLGILNLLPIPVLDGGQLVFFLVEAVRRKPLSLRAREVGQWVGMGFLGFLMVLVFYNDIGRLVTRFTTITEVEETAPRPPAPAAEAAPGGAGQ